jgi:hypothetical protein
MRTLPANTLAHYLRAGKRPRAFVSISGASRYWGSADHGNHLDRMAGGGEITRSIDPAGGQSILSGCTLSLVNLGEPYQPYTLQLIDPAVEGSINGAGTAYFISGSYAGSRGNSYGFVSDGSIDAGRRVAGGVYYTYRGYFQAEIPPYTQSCAEAYISLVATHVFAGPGFNLVAVAGNWTGIAGGMYNDFDGWASGLTPYTGAVLTEPLAAGDLAAGETVYLRLNAAGRAAVVAASGGMLQLAIISSRDYAATSPVAEEYARFKVSRLEATPSLSLHVNANPLDNQAALIHVGFAERDNSLPAVVSDANMIRVWSGVVDRVEALGAGTIQLGLTGKRYQRDLMIPSLSIDADDFAAASVDVLDRPYPVAYGRTWPDGAYGRHLAGIGMENIGGVANPLSGLRDYFPCPVIDPGAADHSLPMVAMVSARELHDSVYGFPALWDQSLGMFVRFWANATERDPVDTYCAVEFAPKIRVRGSNPSDGDALAVVYEDFMGAAASIIPAQVYESDGVSDPEESFAENGTPVDIPGTDDYIMFGFSQIGRSGEIDKVELVFELDGGTNNYLTCDVFDRPEEIAASGTNGATLHVGPFIPPDSTPSYVSFTSAGADFVTAGVSPGDMLVITSGPNRGRWPIYDVGPAYPDQLVLAYIQCPLIVATNQEYHVLKPLDDALITVLAIRGSGQRVIDLTDAMDWGIESKLVRLKYDTANAPVNPFAVSNVQLRIFYTPRAAIDTVWLDQVGPDDGAGGDITGTPNAVIENPAHVIAAVAHHEGGIPLAEIDMDSIEEAAVSLTGWLFSFAMPEQIHLMNYYGATGILAELARQCGAAVYEDWQGLLKLRVFSPADTFPHSGADAPADLDIADYDSSPTGDFITRHAIEQGTFSMRQIGADEVKNDYELRYRLNYASGKYERSLTITNGGGDPAEVEHNINASYLADGRTTAELAAMCAASRTLIRATNRLTFEASAIRDEQTATRLLQRLIEWHTPRRWELGFTTWLNGLCWEEGDMVNVRTPQVYSLFGAALAERKKWRIVELATGLGPYRVRVRAIEADAEVI